jgi:hypothetical protein
MRAIDTQVAQRVAPYTTDVRYHWIHRQTTTKDLRLLVDDFDVRYAVLRDAERYMKRNRRKR